ncbi:MAG: cytochrome c [Gammaproteobacteria bacterium]|jgi:cytochrome c553
MWATKRSAWMFLCAFLLVIPLSVFAEPVDKGAMLSITCNGCHGTDGKSSGAIPSIAGKSADYIAKAMQDFKQEKRPSTVMNRHAKGYSDAEIKLIADYFASKK